MSTYRHYWKTCDFIRTEGCLRNTTVYTDSQTMNITLHFTWNVRKFLLIMNKYSPWTFRTVKKIVRSLKMYFRCKADHMHIERKTITRHMKSLELNKEIKCWILVLQMWFYIHIYTQSYIRKEGKEKTWANKRHIQIYKKQWSWTCTKGTNVKLDVRSHFFL